MGRACSLANFYIKYVKMTVKVHSVCGFNYVYGVGIISNILR